MHCLWGWLVESEKMYPVHHSKTNVTQFSFSLLRIKASTCFERYLLILRRHYRSGTWDIACVLCQLPALLLV
jgi:hypothetical protein